MRTMTISGSTKDTKIKLQKAIDKKEYVYSIYQKDKSRDGGAGYLFLSSWYPSDKDRRVSLKEVLDKLQRTYPLTADVIEKWREE